MAVDLIANHKTIMAIELVVFDKDGTLTCVHTYWCNMIRFRAEGICLRLNLDPIHVPNLMDAMGVDVETRRIKATRPVGIKKRAIVLHAAVAYLDAIGYGNQTGLVTAIAREVDDMSVQRFDDIVRPIKGLKGLLEALKQRSVTIAIATTDLAHRAELAAAHLGIGKYIDMIIGADSVPEAKPAPAMLNRICGRFGISPGAAVMVGDADTDIRMGLNAGFKASIAVATGLTEDEILRELTPYRVGSIADIAIRD